MEGKSVGRVSHCFDSRQSRYIRNIVGIGNDCSCSVRNDCSATQSNELSKWMCSSTNDGTTTVSEQSMTSWPLRYLPIPAIRPSTRRYRLVEFSGEYVGDRGIGKNSVGQYLSTSDSDLLSPTIEIRTHADESQQMDDS